MDHPPLETRPTPPSQDSIPPEPLARPTTHRAWLGAVVGLLLAAWVLPELLPADSSHATVDDPLTETLVEAQQANAANDVERERRALQKGRQLEGDAKDLAEIERRLAVIEWKIDADFDTARNRLVRATQGAEPAQAWLALARMESARDDFAAATKAASRALASAERQADRQEAELAHARAVIAGAGQHRRAGKALASEALEALEAAVDTLHRHVTDEPGVLEPSHWLLRGALLAERGDLALLAWRSYFQLGPGQAAPSAIVEAGGELGRTLPNWPGVKATTEERIALAVALAGSRFFEEARLVALAPSAPAAVRQDTTVQRLLDYADTLDHLRRMTEEYYRQHSLGEADVQLWSRELQTTLRDFVLRHGGGDPGTWTVQAINDYLATHFGTYVNVGRTGGVDDLHMGHRVVDERRTLEQYGKRAEVRLIALDALVSNGYQSWAWEDGGQHGGWANGATIYQVRPAYAGDPVRIWRAFQSPEQRAELEEKMARAAAGDDARAQEDPYGHLPGLLLRLRQQGIANLVGGLEAEGHQGEALRLAFLNDFAIAAQESSIFAHEGRHVIDLRAGLQDSQQLEYFAKLSEVAFSSIPRLSLGSIFSANIADGSPHGEANREIMQGLVGWMETHRESIEGLDPDRPLLPQFDRLTDDQIRDAFRSLDPLAKTQSPQS